MGGYLILLSLNYSENYLWYFSNMNELLYYQKEEYKRWSMVAHLWTSHTWYIMEKRLDMNLSFSLTNKLHEPLIFPNQQDDQVFYVEDKLNPEWSVVLKIFIWHQSFMLKINWTMCGLWLWRFSYDANCDEWEDDIETESFHVTRHW
jgi:hypothetical protein